MQFALNEWIRVLGREWVTTSKTDLRDAGTATFASDRVIPAILRPGTREEVQACVRIANRRGVALYPISSGKNWGYGSRVPAADHCALLDLSRMDRIVDFNEDLAYVTVEPGVRQRQLFEFLAFRKSKL